MTGYSLKTVWRTFRTITEKGLIQVEGKQYVRLTHKHVTVTHSVIRHGDALTRHGDVETRHGDALLPIYSNTSTLLEDIPVQDTSTSTEERKRKQAKKKKDGGAKFYDWKQYDIGTEAWDKVRQGEYPEKENYATMIIGAYLVALKYAQDLSVKLGSSDYSRLLGGARQCFDYFEKDMSRVMEYVSWFCNQSGDSFVGRAGWTTHMLFMNSNFRQFEAAPKAKAKTTLSNVQQRNNALPGQKAYMDEAERMADVQREWAELERKKAERKKAKGKDVASTTPTEPEQEETK